jgi:NADH-quinone oxidoreductase subunit L
MEAPLPASALIHSATLVAAGIFLFLRFSVLFSNFLLSFISLYFILTFFIGSIISSYQTDVKKILAYSTISNCGLMFISIFFTSKRVNLLYFSYHGFYKSLSFLIVGQLILNFNHNQDIRIFSVTNYVFLIKTIYIFLSLWSLSSIVFVYKNFIKHFIFSNNIYLFLLKFIFLNSIVFSIIYSYKIYFFFLKKKILKNHNNYNNFSETFLVVVFFIFILLFFFNYYNYFVLEYSFFLQNKYSIVITVIIVYFFSKI